MHNSPCHPLDGRFIDDHICPRACKYPSIFMNARDFDRGCSLLRNLPRKLPKRPRMLKEAFPPENSRATSREIFQNSYPGVNQQPSLTVFATSDLSGAVSGVYISPTDMNGAAARGRIHI